MTNALLEKLLTACNKSSALVERQKFNITQKRYDFYHLLTISERLKCHEQLEIIGRQTGALRVNYAAKAFGEEDLIESIVLSDVRQLCNLLNIPVHSENTALAIAVVETIKDSCPPWLSEILAEIQEGWRQGKKPYHFSTADHHKIKDICTFVAWAESVNDSQLVALDIRTVSVQLFNDSKRLEKLASKVKSLMKNQLPKEVQELDSVEVLAYLGVSRFPPLFRFKGVVSIQFRTGEMATTHCWPNIGISPDGIVNVTISKPPSYVLFIENQTTFERYCREVNDSGLIFYTNGFPSRTWQSLYTKIEGLLPPNTPLFHWGDIDIGGYNILAFMSSLFERSVTPYMMNPIEFIGTSEKYINTEKLIKCLDRVNSGPIDELRNVLSSSDIADIPWVEQESLKIKAVR